MTNIIETAGLTKVFGSNGAAVHALRGIDMTVSRGEFVASEVTACENGLLVRDNYSRASKLT